MGAKKIYTFPLKSKITYLTRKIIHFKPFLNLRYGKNKKMAYFSGNFAGYCILATQIV